MLPASLEEAEFDGPPIPVGELGIGQRFVDANGIIYEKNDANNESWVVSGEQRGEFVYPDQSTLVQKIKLKEK